MRWDVLKKSLRWLGWTLLILIVSFVALNAFDREWSDSAKTMGQAPANSYSAEKNLYVALKGFSALPGESVTAAGVRRIAEENRIVELSYSDIDGALEQSMAEGPSSLEFKDYIDFCQVTRRPCFGEIDKYADQTRRALIRNPELYDRYLLLARSEGYFETVKPSWLAIGTAYPPLGVRALFHANVALRMKQGPLTARKEALNELHADIEMWKKMLQGEGSLISKMIALAGLHGDFLLVGEMIADRDLDLAPHAKAIDAMLATMQPQDWSIGSLFDNEFRTLQSRLQSLKEADPLRKEDESDMRFWLRKSWNKVEAYFFQPGASINETAEHLAAIKRVADADAADYLREKEAYRQLWRDEYVGFQMADFYNPTGRIIVGFSVGAYSTYTDRAHDIASVQRLARLAYEIRKAKIPNDGIPAFMAQHPEWATHPASGAAFIWDAQKTVLSTPRLEPSDERRFEIPFAGAEKIS